MPRVPLRLLTPHAPKSYGMGVLRSLRRNFFPRIVLGNLSGSFMDDSVGKLVRIAWTLV